MWGGFNGEGFKTVIPNRAYAKISCRLVPDQDPQQIARLVEEELRRLAPPTVQVGVRSRQGAPAFLTPLDSPEMRAAARAYARVFGVEPVYMREGGSIPIVVAFRQALAAPIILMGFGLGDDNLHAPNEKFHLPNFYRGIRTVIAFFEELA